MGLNPYRKARDTMAKDTEPPPPPTEPQTAAIETAMARGFTCIGCGQGCAQPFTVRETRMIRAAGAHAAGYCDLCLGGRKELAAIEAAAAAEVAARAKAQAKQTAEHKKKSKKRRR